MIAEGNGYASETKVINANEVLKWLNRKIYCNLSFNNK